MDAIHRRPGESAAVAGRRKVSQGGFTLIEILITIAVLSIIMAFGVPSMREFFDAKRLVGTAEQVYGHLQQARMESIARSAPVFVNFSTDGSDAWTYGVSTRDLCDVSQTAPANANACALVVDDGDNLVDAGDGATDPDDLILMRFDDTLHNGVTMDINAFSSGTTQIRFDPVRGTASSGDVVLVSELGRRLNVRVGLLGQIRICSPDGSAIRYSTAGC